jgi:hypothetical protein
MRDTNRPSLFKETLVDLRFAGRLHVRQPGLVLTAGITLAAGIAVTTAALSLAHAVLLRPLPYVDPDRLVHVGEQDLRNAAAAQASAGRNVSWPDFLDFRSHQRTFVDLAGYSGGSRTLTGAGPADRLPIAEVTDGFLRLLGVQPQLGRDFRPEDSDPSAPGVVLLTDGIWRRRFGGDPGVLDRTVVLSGQPARIIGVLPPDFQFPLRGLAELWLPIRPSPAQVERRYFHWLNVIGRAAPGCQRRSGCRRSELDRRRLCQDRSQIPWNGRGLGAASRRVHRRRRAPGSHRAVRSCVPGAVHRLHQHRRSAGDPRGRPDA